MRRFPSRLSVLALSLTLAAGTPYAHAAKTKKKKSTDLSAPAASEGSKQPDKELYDKAQFALKKGRYDVARLDLQTLLNTYPDSEYQMRAKLTVGDTWFKEGGSASLAQAEQEYKDFITFFPNTPEAAEAQMKVGDIYYMQMDKEDRDPQNAIHAEQEYRTMLQQFPDSTLVPRAKQRLREVQEVLAARQFEIGQFYVGRENWPAAIARLQTVADSYPLFSHSDQTLISIGDAYASEAEAVKVMNIPPRAKEALAASYDDRAVAAWDKVVTRYAMSPHVEDAKDRLIAMGRPVPEPTQQEMAESEAEESSRVPVRMRDHVLLAVQHGPSTVASARVGDPTMTDPAPTLAPAVEQESINNFTLAVTGKPIPSSGANSAVAAAAINNGTAPPVTGTPAPVTMESVGEAPAGNNVGAEIVSAPNNTAPAGADPATSGATGPGTPAGAAPSGAGAVVTAPTNPATGETLIATPPSGSTTGSPAEAGNPGTALAPGTHNPVSDYNLLAPKTIGAPTTLPPVDKPAGAVDQINDVKSGGAAQVATGTTAGKPKKKNPKPAYNSGQESSSKHKPKKGLDKVNPF